MPAPLRELHDKHRFKVEIGLVESAGFQKCSPLKSTIEKVNYFEGGVSIPYKVPGLITYDDVTLERGTSSNRDLIDWHAEVINAAAAGRGTGRPDPLFRRNPTVVQLGRDGSRLRAWNLFGAWPAELTVGEWDNTTSSVVLEMLVLAYDYHRLSRAVT